MALDMIKLKEIKLDINGEDVTIPSSDIGHLRDMLIGLSYIDPEECDNVMDDREEELAFPAYLSWLGRYTDVLKPIITKKDRGHEPWVFDDFDEDDQ